MAFVLELARSSSFFLLQASSAQSGKTSETNRMRLPSGNQIAPSASVEMFVTFLASPVATPEAASKSWVHTWELPPRELTKRSFLPSGDHRPPVSPAGSEVSWCESPPPSATTQRWEVRLLALRSTSTALNSTQRESGEMAG